MIDIQRDALDWEQAQRISGRLKDEERDSESCSDLCQIRRLRPQSWRKVFNRYLPATDWALNYNLQEDLMADIVAGITIAIMHIPQGLAYAALAETEPIVGIYTAVFPVLIYALFGPSRHVSIGTLSLTCIMAGSVVLRYAPSSGSGSGSGSGSDRLATPLLGGAADTLDTPTATPTPTYSSIQILTALSLLTGLWQTAFAVLGLGRLSWILSEVFVSGYTTGAAFHVLFSQVKGVLGVQLKPDKSPFKLYEIAKEVVLRIDETNWAAVVISVICITTLLINNELIKPRLAKKCSFPLPIQLIVVAVATAFSYFLDFETKYNVTIVGDMPTGLPPPEVPDSSLFSDLVVDSLVIAVVGYCISLSMAKIFANKFNYQIDGGQESLAQGLSNIFGSFFSCLPSASSMARSVVQVEVGGRTQLTSLVSLVILVFVLFFAGPLFTALPKAVLSSIVIVALKGMLRQLTHLPRFYAQSKLDGLLWLASFLAVIVLNIDTGLVIGVGLSLTLFVYRSVQAGVTETGLVRDTGLTEDADKAGFARRPPGAIVLRVDGSVSFANFEAVLDAVRRRLKNERERCIILDFSGVPFIDPTAAKNFKAWLQADKHALRLIAAPNASVASTLSRADVSRSLLFPTVLDALALYSMPVRRRGSDANSGVTDATTLAADANSLDAASAADLSKNRLDVFVTDVSETLNRGSQITMLSEDAPGRGR